MYIFYVLFSKIFNKKYKFVWSLVLYDVSIILITLHVETGVSINLKLTINLKLAVLKVY